MTRFKRLMAIILTVCCIFVFSGLPTFAASKTVTRTYDVTTVDNGFKALYCYARDNFKIAYDGKKVVSCTASQTKKDLDTGMFGKGGIKCIKKTNSKWTYQSIWSINLRLMPSSLLKVAKKVAPEIVAIQKIGTIVKITTTYEVNANGTLKKTSTSVKWFTEIAKYINQVKKFIKI